LPSNLADQCVTPNSFGGPNIVSTTTARSSITGGCPDRGRSPSAPTPPAVYRDRQSITVGRDTPTISAIAVSKAPARPTAQSEPAEPDRPPPWTIGSSKSARTHHQDAGPAGQQQTYPILPNTHCKVTYDTRHATRDTSRQRQRHPVPVRSPAPRDLALTATTLPLGGTLPQSLSPEALLAVIILGTASTGITFHLTYRIIADGGATNAATVSYLLPAVAVALGAIVLREEIGLRAIIGGCVVLAGVALTRAANKSHARNTSPYQSSATVQDLRFATLAAWRSGHRLTGFALGARVALACGSQPYHGRTGGWCCEDTVEQAGETLVEFVAA